MLIQPFGFTGRSLVVVIILDSSHSILVSFCPVHILSPLSGARLEPSWLDHPAAYGATLATEFFLWKNQVSLAVADQVSAWGVSKPVDCSTVVVEIPIVAVDSEFFIRPVVGLFALDGLGASLWE